MSTLDEDARAIVDANAYMTLGTADAEGRPWATPVWFAHAGYRDYFWISKPGARHSRNLAVRPEVGIVIFDSTVPPGTGGGLYLEATAAEVTDDLESGVDVFARRSVEQGAGTFTVADVTGDAPHRLFRATASAHYLLDGKDQRIPVTP